MDLSSGSATQPIPVIPRIVINNFPSAGTKEAGIWVGQGPPGLVPGSRAKHLYLDEPTGDVYELGADMATWTPVTNIKGPAGDTVLDPVERQKLLDDLAAADADGELDPDVDLVLLFENALAG